MTPQFLSEYLSGWCHLSLRWKAIEFLKIDQIHLYHLQGEHGTVGRITIAQVKKLVDFQ